MARLDLLRDELINDPLVRDYAGMTDQAAADDLNLENRTIERTRIAGSDIFNAIVPSEFAALTAEVQGRVRDVFGLGDSIDVSSGTNARQVLLDAFGAGTQTRANLVGVVQKNISRAEEIGFFRTVTANDVRWARS